jgi:hypothetical protein
MMAQRPKTQLVVLVALLVITSSAAGAFPEQIQTQFPDQARAELRKRFPEGEIFYEAGAVGDLNGDGIPDAAAPFSDPEDPNDDKRPRSVRVAVLLGERKGGFRQFVTSPDLHVEGAVAWLRIERRRLFIDLTTERGAPTRPNSTYEFALRGGELMLVGEVHANVKVYDHPEIPEWGSRFDYLARRVIYWRTQYGKTVRVVRPLPRLGPEPLRAFDTGEHDKKLYRVSHKYIDDNWTLREPP